MEAIRRDAEICPVLEEMYSLMGEARAQDTDQQIADVINAIPGVW